MNKILKAILILITVFAVVTVTGCTLLDNLLGTPDPDPNPDHHHEFSSEWSMDEEYHWHAATCGHDDAVSKVAHEWQAPDCTNAKTCKDCGKTVGEALGHLWNEGTVITPSTEETEGVVEYECMVCGEKKTDKLDKLAHTHIDENADFVCDKCKEDLPDVKRFEAEDAEYHNGTVNFENTGRASGDVCVSYFREGKVIVFTVIANKAEQNVPIVICGSSANESNGKLLEITAEELTAMIKNNGVAIRDAEGGFAGSDTQDWYNFTTLTAYIDLAQGKNVITFENLGPAMNMDYIEIQSTDAKLSWTAGIGAQDCVDAEKNHACDVCGINVGTHAAAAGTHVCEYCGQNVSECVDANTNHECDVCGESMGTHAAAEGSHNCDYCGKALSKCDDNYDEGKIDFDATCTEPGQKTYTCSVCGGTKVEAIPQNGHSDEDGDYYCDVCNESLCENHVAAEAVKENEVAPGCVSEGKYDSVVYCKNCGDTISRETITINPKGHNHTYEVAGTFSYNVKDGSHDASGLSIVVGCKDCDEYIGETLTGCSIDLANIDTTGAVVSCAYGDKVVSCVMPAFNVENYTASTSYRGYGHSDSSDTNPIVTTVLTAKNGSLVCTVITGDSLQANGQHYSRYELGLLNSDSVHVSYVDGKYVYDAISPVTLTREIRTYGTLLIITGEVTFNLTDRWTHNNGFILGSADKAATVNVNVNGSNAIFLWDGAKILINEGSTLNLTSTDPYCIYTGSEGSSITVDGTLNAAGKIQVTTGVGWSHPDGDRYNITPEIYVRKGTINATNILANFIQVGSVKNGYYGTLNLSGDTDLLTQSDQGKSKAVRWVFSNGEINLTNTGSAAINGFRRDNDSDVKATFDSGIKVNMTGNFTAVFAHAWALYTNVAIHTDAKFNVPEGTAFHNHENDYSEISINFFNEATITIDGEERTVWVANARMNKYHVQYSYSLDEVIPTINDDGSRSPRKVVPADGEFTTVENTGWDNEVGDWNFSKATNANGDVIYYMAIN